jgi:hypothetical protein
MQLIYYGWASAEWNKYLDNTVVILRDCTVKRCDIKTKYLDSEFLSCYRIYKNFKRFGLPHGLGWINESAQTIELLNFIQDEVDACEYEEIKKRKK